MLDLKFNRNGKTLRYFFFPEIVEMTYISKICIANNIFFNWNCETRTLTIADEKIRLLWRVDNSDHLECIYNRIKIDINPKEEV